MMDVVDENGSPRRVEELYRSESARLHRSLVGWSGSPDVAAEAVSETFAQLLGRGDAVRDPRAWVWRTAFRVAAGELARRSDASSLPAPALVDEPEPPPPVVELLAELSELQRSAVVLHHYAGFTTEEVADIVDSTPAAVRVHLMRGRRRLRALLEALEVAGDDR